MDAAIELALLELGVGRDEVEVDVVSTGRAGILGIGSEDAKVRVIPIGGAGAGASAGLGVVRHILELLDVEAQPSIRSSGGGPDDPPIIDVQGEDAGLIIGRRGDTLRALQFVTNMILGRQREDPTPVIVDVEGYRDRRFAHLRQLATRTAQRVTASGQAVTLEPMPPAERRMIHVTLADNRGVRTESSGDGNERRVTIEPTGEAAPRPQGGARGGGRRGRRPTERQPDAVESQPGNEWPDDGPPLGHDDEQDDDGPQPGNEGQPELDDDEPDDDGPQPGNESQSDFDDDEDDDGPQPGNVREPELDDEQDDDGPQPGNR
ncbi:MAG: protein jag [Chloroflexi bacterium]|nr:protein jag [Chloroflexota bacterium]